MTYFGIDDQFKEAFFEFCDRSTENKRNNMNAESGKDETKITDAVFTTNLVFFWLKSKLCLTNKRLTGQVPNTILGFIPAGKSEIVHPVKSISSVGYSTKAHPRRLILGLLLLLFGLAIHSFGSLLYFLLGLIMLNNSYTTKFEVFTNTARPQGFEISILEKSKMEDFVTEIKTLITK